MNDRDQRLSVKDLASASEQMNCDLLLAHIADLEADVKYWQDRWDKQVEVTTKRIEERDALKAELVEARKELHHEKVDNGKYLARAWVERDAALARAAKFEKALKRISHSALGWAAGIADEALSSDRAPATEGEGA